MIFEEIVSNFEHRSIQHRKEFIECYDFNDNYKVYYRNFIINYKRLSNYLYFSDLVELASYLNFFDELIISKFEKILFGKAHYIIKLAILDYYLDYGYYHKREGMKDINYLRVENLENLLLLKQRKIVTNQIYLVLLFFFPKKTESLFVKLLSSLNKTTDHRSFIRTFNTLVDFEDSYKINKKQQGELLQIAQAKDLGKAVKTSIEEYKKIIGF